MTGYALASLCRFVCGTSVQWHCDPGEQVQRIYFGNHSSHLDFIVIWSALPAHLRERVRPVAARDYWERTALRRHLATHVFNAILVDRGPVAPTCPTEANEQRGKLQTEATLKAEAARATTLTIATGMGDASSLILFPEGTRCATGSISPFKSGLYFLSRTRPDVELIPVYLENLNRILPKGEALPVPMLSRVIFGPPFVSTAVDNKALFLEQARNAVIQLGVCHGAEC